MTLLAALGSCLVAATPPPSLVIPRIPDPPPVIDGRLDEWRMRPLRLTYNDPNQVVYGKTSWTDLKDLSGWATLGWDGRHLYVAAHVVDEKHCQPNKGRNMYRGDHLELFLHFPRGGAGGRGGMMFQFGLSPGNFSNTGDPLADIKPESIVYFPDGRHVPVAVAVQRTTDGYEIEAAVPWADLGVERPELGMALGLDLCLGDTDADTPIQETLSSLSTAPWRVRSPSRMAPTRLGNADGKAPARAESVSAGRLLLAGVELASGQHKDVPFTVTERPSGKQAVLVLQGRLGHQKVAGGTFALNLAVNGRQIDVDRLLNKPSEFTFYDGRIQASWKLSGFFVYYSPDFKAAETTKTPYKPVDAPAYRFELLIDDLIQPGQNTLRIKHNQPRIDNPLFVADVRLSYRDTAKLTRREEDASPPTGPLPVCEPLARPKVNYKWATLTRGGAIHVEVNGEHFVVGSRFSHPTPGWLVLEGGGKHTHLAVERKTAYWRLRRVVEPLDECLVVSDTFTSTTDQDVGIMARHEVQLGDRLVKLYVNGLYVPTRSAANGEPANPTTVALTRTAGIGLMPEDDVFRVHSLNYGRPTGLVGLADNHFVLRAGKTHTMRWAIYPLSRCDYFAFVNAARRRLGTNFTIDGSFTFANWRKPFTSFTDEQFRDYARFKGAKFVAATIVNPRYKGRYAHGTAFQRIDHSLYAKLFEAFKNADPTLKSMIYFHCFISTEDGATETYKDAALLKPDGTQGNYRNPIYPIFVPTETNSYGPAVAKNVDIILDKIGADGVYWDELAYSAFRYHFGQPWGGVTADIDPKTMKIKRRKSSVTLLTQPWRLKLARRILDSGKLLIGNGNPHTETFTRLHFPRFVETASATNMARSQLYTPIGLGDHLGEKNEVHAYRNMVRYLDFGGVYYWYFDQIVPTRPTLTSYMFPVTPIELHEGYLIAKERILTNRSGLFGWGDASRFDAVVFDSFGRQDTKTDVPLVKRDGKHYAEVRIPKGCSVAIIRKPA